MVFFGGWGGEGLPDEASLEGGHCLCNLVGLGVVAGLEGGAIGLGVITGQYLIVWAASPFAPQRGQVYARSTGQVTLPSASFRQ